MTQERAAAKAAVATPEPAGFRISEDWAATFVGLILVVLVLVGIIAKGMVP
jgi:hypothetical protein